MPETKKKKGKNKKAKGESGTTSTVANVDDFDEAALDNLILRIKLPQAVKVLLPVAIFVVTNNACKFPITSSLLA